MKNIGIKKISLVNFKGLRNQEIIFDKNTNIFGDNGTGKTTIFDAFTWMLFGKDSTDRKDFEIKTLDKNNVVIPQIEHEVSAIILFDNEEINIRRILKENWVKKRGSLESEFSGNVTDYYWNEVPMQQKEFQTKVSQILDETVFKMITNPLAFNSLKWQDRRNALMQIAGEISDSELASGNIEYEKLIAQLINGKTLEDYRKQIAASIKKAKEDLKAIPIRVDEVVRQMPEEINFETIAKNLTVRNSDLHLIDQKIQNSNLAVDDLIKERNSQSINIGNLKNEISNIETVARNEANKPADNSELTNLTNSLESKKDELLTAQNTINSLSTKLETLNSDVASFEGKMNSKRQEWIDENATELTFNDNDFHCPTCKREFESGDLESKKILLIENFKNAKNQRLSEINRQGANLKLEKEIIDAEILVINSRIEKGKLIIISLKEEVEIFTKKIETLASEKSTEPKDVNLIFECILSLNQEYKAKKLQVEKLEEELVQVPVIDNEQLIEERKSIINDIDNLKGQLNIKVQIDNCKERINDLSVEEKTLAQQIANVEKTQFVIENFNKLKIDTLEQKINSKFKFVNFRMFETQINGGESECCDALIDGVPFSDANTASKINAGLDIINTLCEFYQVTAPIFIDNRESIIQLIDSESQIVNLIVSGEDKKLRVA